VDDDDRRPPAVSAWTMPAVSASSSRSGGTHGAPRRAGRRAPVVTCLVGAALLLAGLGAAGPPTPVTAAEVLPPPDTSAVGATGRLPDAGLVSIPPGTLPLETGMPPLGSGTPPLDGAPIPDGTTVSGITLGIPETVLAAYRAAATTVDRTAPGCRLTWPLVAGIGKIESGHASGGAVDADGTTRRPILGPQLTGTGGNAAIRDTDGGALDHDATWDRAVGPTQFIPSSWRIYGADGNGDGRADPDNVFDAGLATARYLCAGGGDLSDAAARHDAVFSYNHSEAYVATVLRWADAYASGALPVPDSTGSGSGGDDTLVDAAPSLAALPSTGVPTAGGVPMPPLGAPLVAPPASGAPMITSSGATRPSTPATRSPGPDLAPAPAGPASPTIPASSTAPGSSTPRSASAATSTSTTSTSTSATSPSATSPSSSPPPPATSTTSGPAPKPAPPSTPAPSKSAPPKPAPLKPAPPKPAPPTSAPSTPAPSSTTASTSTSPTAPTPAARCTAALPAVARAFGAPAAQLSAASAAGPGAGRTTCTVRGPRGPLVVAVTAGPGAAAPATPSAGVSRTVAGGRTVLTVPAASGVPADRARVALATVAGAWG
jgi:hypothetical protein